MYMLLNPHYRCYLQPTILTHSYPIFTLSFTALGIFDRYDRTVYIILTFGGTFLGAAHHLNLFLYTYIPPCLLQTRKGLEENEANPQVTMCVCVEELVSSVVLLYSKWSDEFVGSI